MIEHIVISGGSWKGLYMLGILKELINTKYLNIENIKTLWTTSIGGLLGIILSVKMDIDDIIDFYVNVPVKGYGNFTLNLLIEIYENCGLLDDKFIFNLLNNIFLARGLDIKTITLKEFYEYSNIEQHFFCVNYGTSETKDFNYLTNPNEKLLDVLYCSCSLPILFKPKSINKTIYLDGGMNIHYPSTFALKKHKNESILGITTKVSTTCSVEYDNLLTFLKNLFNKVFFYKQQKCYDLLVNEIKIKTDSVNIENIFMLMSNKEERKIIVEKGIEIAKEYLLEKKNKLVNEEGEKNEENEEMIKES